MRNVFSSHVQSIGHDPETSELTVVYKNGTHTIYDGVPEDVATKIFQSESIGSALHEHVKGQYQHRYLKK